MGTRKSYSKEFKVNAVRMITEEGRRAAEVARDLGISYNMLLNWKRKLQEDHEDAFPGHGKLKSTEESFARISAEGRALIADKVLPTEEMG